MKRFILTGVVLILVSCKTTAESGLADEQVASAAPPSTRRVLANYSCPDSGLAKVAFFDADSTLRISQCGAPSANGATDVLALPFAAEKIKQLVDEGYLIAIVSNQGGVPRYVSLEVAEQALVLTAKAHTELGATFHYLDFATADDGREFRKPQVGMARKLEEVLGATCPGVVIDYAHSFMAGDAGYKRDEDGPHPDGRPADDFSNSDRGFAENLEIPFYEPTDFFNWRAFEVYNIHDRAELDAFLEQIEAAGTEDASGRLTGIVTQLRRVNAEIIAACD